MWNTIADKMSTFLGRGFFVVYWGPAAFGMGSIFGVSILLQGFYPTIGWLSGSSTVTSIFFFLGIVMVITMISYLLVSFHRALIQLYEGYWPEKPGIISWLKQKSASRQNKRSHRESGFLHYPLDKKRFKPTRLGNMLAAAEEYPTMLYRIDAILWWPRLVTLLPDTITNAISEAEAYMIALLNMSTIFLLLIPVEVILTLHLAGNWWTTSWLIVVSGLLSWPCYHAAVSQAESYGAMVRTAFDLYRNTILTHMHVPLPPSLADEQSLWEALNEWVRDYTPPWNTPVAEDSPQLKWPFTYSKQNTEGQQADLQKNKQEIM